MGGYDLVIRGGSVVSATDVTRCDVAVSDGRVVALGANLDGGATAIDAVGKWVLPGGIDSHCHIEQESSMGVWTADDFYTGTLAAACGGTTTIIPFAAQYKGQSLRQVVRDYHARAEPKAVIDYAFHLIISDPTAQVLGQELPALIKDGYTSFKIYTTYDALRLDDRQILEVLAVARREGAMVMVHAENHDIIAWLGEKLLEAGRSAPKYHGVAHAAVAEREATHRAISLAEIVDVPLLIVHVSGHEAIEQIRWAQSKGLRIYGETCPQYLFLTADDMDRPGFAGAMCMCSPPPRDKANQEAVWRGLQSRVFQVFSSDHAPYRYDDVEGKLRAGAATTFKTVANGVPGIELRLPLLFSEGVMKRRISISQFVELTATAAAKLYGLYPRKGTIAVGADADIVIWDETRETTVTLDLLHENMDYTPYEGMELRGWPVTVISRGEVVVDDDTVMASRGRGRFLPCDLPEPARPAPGPQWAATGGFNPTGRR